MMSDPLDGLLSWVDAVGNVRLAPMARKSDIIDRRPRPLGPSYSPKDVQLGLV